MVGMLDPKEDGRGLRSKGYAPGFRESWRGGLSDSGRS
jgi:hypothetical protein